MIGKTTLHCEPLEKFGQGGMGVVCKARDIKFRRPVAPKSLPEDLLHEREAESKLSHRAKAASVEDHPNTTTIVKTDKTEGECTRHRERFEKNP